MGLLLTTVTVTLVSYQMIFSVFHIYVGTDLPCSPKAPNADAMQNSVTSSDSAVTSSLNVVTSSPSSSCTTEVTSSATGTFDTEECIVKVSANIGSGSEEETEAVSQDLSESVEKGKL